MCDVTTAVIQYRNSGVLECGIIIRALELIYNTTLGLYNIRVFMIKLLGKVHEEI